jgi:hypothetical protein
MTDAEDQIRRYAAAVTRSQRPIELGEITTRSRGRRRRRPAVVAAALVIVVAVVATVVVIGQGHGSPTRVEVAPASSPSTVVAPAANCPAASLAVTSTSGERLHPGWLPPGFVLTAGNESDIGGRGDLTYSTPGNGDHPRVEILRYRSNQPFTSLYSGTEQQPLTVQGEPGILSVGVPQATPLFKAVLWRPAAGLVLVVNGYKLGDADLIRVADNLEYDSGGTFTYPVHPGFEVTRAQALAAAGGAIKDPRAVLTSFGELDAVSTRTANHFPTLATGIAVTQPVWVVWTPAAGGPSDQARAAIVVATAGTVAIAAVASVKEGALDSLTDRSAPTCAPPFGVLTRSEVAYLRPPLGGAHSVTKLTTERALLSVPQSSEFLQCSIDVCDPAVPVWVLVQTASDQRFTEMESRPPGATPGDTKPGSFSITMLDARTGPQTTNVGSTSELGGGAPPAALLAITDLAPG